MELPVQKKQTNNKIEPRGNPAPKPRVQANLNETATECQSNLSLVICWPSLEAGSQPKPAAGSQAKLEPLEILWAGGYSLHLSFKIAGYRPKKNKIKQLPVTVHVANLLTLSALPFKRNTSLTIANQCMMAHVPRTRAQHLAMYRMPQDLHMSWVFVPLKNSQSHGLKAGPAQAMGGGSGLTFSRPKPLKAGPKPQLSGQAGPANHYLSQRLTGGPD
ncbi:hypothetical protein H4582DRAFT_2060323 [Lactarius indigo]|nr:hypothetical protein H4582DRAFT_2060323 [Lactarius indigo]